MVNENVPVSLAGSLNIWWDFIGWGSCLPNLVVIYWHYFTYNYHICQRLFPIQPVLGFVCMYVFYLYVCVCVDIWLISVIDKGLARFLKNLVIYDIILRIFCLNRFHVACASGQIKIVDQLLQYGAEPNVLTIQGNVLCRCYKFIIWYTGCSHYFTVL